jgi:hypothetical protein
MSVSISRIYSQNTPSNAISITESFRYADFLYMVAPDEPDGIEIEIDATVIVEIDSFTKRSIALESFELTTTELLCLPVECQRSELLTTVCLSSSASVFLEIYAVSTTDDDLQEIKTKLNLILLQNIGVIANQIGQNAAIGLLAGGIGVALSPITAGASLALGPAVAAPLSVPTATLGLLLLPGV